MDDLSVFIQEVKVVGNEKMFLAQDYFAKDDYISI